jgi:uncharacterized protein GlcG (DUF336 family)
MPSQSSIPAAQSLRISTGKVIGAINASGNTPQEDEEIALAGAAVTNSAISESK